MGMPDLIEESRVQQSEDFRIRNYTEKVFWMYDGPEKQVTLRCRHHNPGSLKIHSSRVKDGGSSYTFSIDYSVQSKFGEHKR